MEDENAAQDKPAKGKKKNKSAPKLWRDVQSHIDTHDGKLVPGLDNPYCIKCKMLAEGCRGPLKPVGSEKPTVTVVLEAVSQKEIEGGVACEGSRNGVVRRHVERLAASHNISPEQIRWLPITRCVANTKVNYKTKANWCRTFAVDDLRQHPPSLVLAVGTTVLGSLSFKSSAQDWSGLPLTWRGWPDDWLLKQQFTQWGHPSRVPKPDESDRRQLMAVQAPYIIYAAQSQDVLRGWLRQINQALYASINPTARKSYVLDHYKVILDPDELITALRLIPDGVDVDYDVETTGLYAFNKTARLTTAMLRYLDNNEAKVLIFPVEHGKMTEHLPRVLPELARVLHNSKLTGHNIAFDIVYTYARLKPYVDLWKLSQAVKDDTRLMAYAYRQSRQSLGLERLAYSWAAAVAGYEEDFVLAMESDELRPTLHPEEGGDYAKAFDIPHVLPAYVAYTGGDVEVVGQAKLKIADELDKTQSFAIPLANPEKLGSFYLYETPTRKFAYEKIIRRGNRVLMRMMARGMHVDKKELDHQEDIFPKLIIKARGELKSLDPRIELWCQQQEATVPDWKLDLENRDQLKTILFDILELPVKRLTESGEKALGEDADLAKLSRDQVMQFAAVDKYTVNSLVADEPRLAPLKEYRKLYKAYTAFVRSMRNITTEGVDKNERKRHQYLMEDWCVHPNFNLAGTDSGRLSACVDGATLINTNHGLVKIMDMLDSDLDDLKVLTHLGRWRKVLEVYFKGIQPMFQVTLLNGSWIICTGEHRFMVADASWQPLSSLKVGSALRIDLAGRASCIDKIEPIGNRGVWDIHVEEDESYYAQGFINHNSSPNAQQIPSNSIIKRMYASRFGKLGCIYQADLSQIELRLLAASCGDPLMVDAYRRKIDLHSLTTHRVFKVPYEHFEKKYMAALEAAGKEKEAKDLDRKRKIGKVTNFLTGYGGGPFGLQTSLAEQGVYLSIEECEYIVEALFDTYPCLRKHIGYYKRFIMDNACAVSLFGRVRWFDEVLSEDKQAQSKALRAGFNHLIQSTASDLMLLGCAAVDHMFQQRQLQSMLVSTVHDSMVVDALRSELPVVHEIVDQVTNNLPDIVSSILGDFDNRWLYTVPIEADAEVGPNYGDAVKIVPDKDTGKVDWDKLFHRWDAAN